MLPSEFPLQPFPSVHMAPRTPSEHPNPTTKIPTTMGGEFTYQLGDPRPHAVSRLEASLQLPPLVLHMGGEAVHALTLVVIYPPAHGSLAQRASKHRCPFGQIDGFPW